MNITSIMEKRKYTLTRILLQNTLNFYYKIRKVFLLENVSAFLLQNTSIYLQNAAGITKCAGFITKRGRYYKTRRLLQNAPSKDQVKEMCFNNTNQKYKLKNKKNIFT